MTINNMLKADLEEVLNNSRKSLLKNIVAVSLLIIATIIFYLSDHFQTQEAQTLQYILPISAAVGIIYTVWETSKYFKTKQEFTNFLENSNQINNNKILSYIKNKKYKRFSLISDYNKKTENFLLYVFQSHVLLIKKDPPKIEIFKVAEIERIKIDIFPNRLSRYNPPTWWIDIKFNDNTNKLFHFVLTENNNAVVELLKEITPRFEVGKVEVDQNEKERVFEIVGEAQGVS